MILRGGGRRCVGWCAVVGGLMMRGLLLGLIPVGLRIDIVFLLMLGGLQITVSWRADYVHT